MNVFRALVIGLPMTFSFLSSQASAGCDCKSTSGDPCTGRSVSVPVVNGRQVSVTWTFSSSGGDAFCGTFANGDFWVAPSTPDGTVVIESVSSTGSGAVSVDENPQLEKMGLLSATKPYGNYSAAENLANAFPRSFSGSTSLVAAVQRDEVINGKCGTSAILGNCVDVYNVLTVLSAAPLKQGIETLRPAIDEKSKDLMTWEDFDLSRIPQVAYATTPTDSQLAAIRQRWSFNTEVLGVKSITGDTYSEGGRAFRASLIADDYGAGVAKAWHDDLFSVFASSSASKARTEALAAMITYGKDLYFAIYGPNGRERNWGSGAGQSLGKFPPAVFFAAMSKDSRFGDNLRTTSETLLDFDDLRGPHELDQVNTGAKTPVWGDFPAAMTDLDIRAYWGGLLKSQCFAGALGSCSVSSGKRTSRDPYGYIDGPPNRPGAGYLPVSLGPQKALVAEMFLIPQMCDIVNFDRLVEYVDRHVDVGLYTKDDPCAAPDPREDPLTCDVFRNVGCKYYGVTWGDSASSPGTCIQNAVGRFPALHGTKIQPLYGTPAVESNWKRIRGVAASCTRPVARQVPPAPPALNVL